MFRKAFSHQGELDQMAACFGLMSTLVYLAISSLLCLCNLPSDIDDVLAALNERWLYIETNRECRGGMLFCLDVVQQTRKH